MTDTIIRLIAALEGRYAIERELGEGGMATKQVMWASMKVCKATWWETIIGGICDR